eukprot:549749_1
MTLLAFIFILSIFQINAIPMSECAIGAFNSGNCLAMCFELGVGPSQFNLTAPDLDIDNIAQICPNVKYARNNYYPTGIGCEYDDLIWDETDPDCACPSCPCTNTNPATTTYTKIENFFDRKCISCTCEEMTLGQSNYGWNCFSYGDDSNPISKSTTPNSWDLFECPPSQGTTCDNNGRIYLNGDGYFQWAECSTTYCYCDSGNEICRTGYPATLGTDDALKAAFVGKCGKDIQGCLDEPSNIVGCGSGFDCPMCGCGTKSVGERWIKEVISVYDSNAKACLSCICENTEDGDVANCGEDVDTYTDSRTCPPSNAATCYYGISKGDEIAQGTYAPSTGECEIKDGQCSWKREDNVFDGEIVNEWGCESSILCKALGLDNECAHASGTIDPAYFGCGMLSEGFLYDSYLGCYGGDNSNNVDIDTTTCNNATKNDKYDAFQSGLFTCLMGTPSPEFRTPFGRIVNYDILQCQNVEDVECQDSNNMDWDNVGNYVYNVNDYIYHSYGCACKTAATLYNYVDQTTQAQMEAENQDFIKNMARFVGQDPVEWYKHLKCNIGTISCDLASGIIVIAPKECGTGSVVMSEYNIIGCADSMGVVGIFPISGLPKLVFNNWENVKNLCPGVAKAAEMGKCSSIDNLVFPDGANIGKCPYCKCDTEATYVSDLTTDINYFFGQLCTTCDCKIINSNNDKGISCTQYGDMTFFGTGFTTTGSYSKYKCPPTDTSTVCTNGDMSYLPGQSYWDAQYPEKFCICGGGECADGVSNILNSANDDLKSQFLLRCGEDLEGCLGANYISNIITRQTQMDMPDGDSNPSCPLCGCSTEGQVYISEEIDYNNPISHLSCKTCVCISGANDDYNGLSVECDDADPYSKLSDIECPPANNDLSCYHGKSDTGIFADGTKGTGQCSSDDDLYCATTYSNMAFGTEFERECGDRVQCEAFGVMDSGCIKASLELYYGWGCGFIADYLGSATQTMDIALDCCNTPNCNNQDFDPDLCITNDDYGTFYKNLFGCMQGSDYETFACPDSEIDITSCSDFKEYIEWIKGCACTTAGQLWKSAEGNSDLRSYLEGKVRLFIDEITTMDGQNINDWNTALGCDFEYKCNIETGILSVSETFCDIENDVKWSGDKITKLCDMCVCETDNNSFWERKCDRIENGQIPDVWKELFMSTCTELDCVFGEVLVKGEDEFNCDCGSFYCKGPDGGMANMLQIFVSLVISMLCIICV